MQKLELLRKYLNKAGRDLSPAQEEQFGLYYDLLVSENENMNLTAITELSEVQEKHFLDSVWLGNLIDLNGKHSLADVGTGAGFPGIPLKIMYPDLEVMLIDSLGKRVDFLNRVIEKLMLTNIKAVHMRAEDAGRDASLREQFDICVSRAVAELRVLSEYCLPLVKPGGSFISYKGKDTDEEIQAAANAVSLLGGEIRRIEKQVIGPSELERTFVFVEKTGKTDEKYPRRAGKVTKKPL